MSWPIATELEEPVLNINDACGAIVEHWKEKASYPPDRLDPEESLACKENRDDIGHTWRYLGFYYYFRIKPGFTFSYAYTMENYVSFLIPPVARPDISYQSGCSTVCTLNSVDVFQSSDVNVVFSCDKESPFNIRVYESWHKVITPVTITVEPSFSGSGILMNGSGRLAYVDDDGKILTAG